MLYGGIKS